MTTQVTTSHTRGGADTPAPVSVRFDYRARAAIRQLGAEDQAAIYAAIGALALHGLPALVRKGRAHRVTGQRLGDGQGPIYEMPASGVADLRIFVAAPQGDGGAALVVTDVLRRSALQYVARGF